MKVKFYKIGSTIAIGLILQFSLFIQGCGVDPLAGVGGDPSFLFPPGGIDSPISSGNYYNSVTNSFGGYYGLQGGGAGTEVFLGISATGQILAPMAGIVYFADSTTGTIKIANNPRFSVQIRGGTTTLQVGTFVTKGQIIGSLNLGLYSSYTTTYNVGGGSGGIYLSTYVDGAPQCPVTFMSRAFLTSISTYVQYGLCR